MYFRYFTIISLLKKAWQFICTNLNPFYSSEFGAMFAIGWSWSCGSWEEQEKVKCSKTDGRPARQTDEWTDGQQVIRKVHFSYQLKWCTCIKQNNPPPKKNIRKLSCTVFMYFLFIFASIHILNLCLRFIFLSSHLPSLITLSDLCLHFLEISIDWLIDWLNRVLRRIGNISVI